MKSPTLFAAALAAGSAAAATSPVPAYRAIGTEPFWSLSIDRGVIGYSPASGKPIAVKAPRPIVGINGELYRTPRLTVDITHVRCSDGMSDRTYRDTVRVTTARGTVRGCGGGVVSDTPGRSLAGSSWTITAIGGRPVRLDRPTEIRFGADRIEGRAGCNRFGGRYGLTRDVLTTDGVISTKMACPGPAMQAENAFFRVIGASPRITWQGRDQLLLSGARTSVALRRVR